MPVADCRSFRRLVLGCALGVAAAGACATTAPGMSAERQQRISECLKRCPASHAEAGPGNVSDRTLDQRNDCERRCYELR